MINLVGPTNITSLSVAGTNYAVVDGNVEVKPEHVAELKDFGFSVPAETVDDPNSVPSEDIGTMNRNELFAFLKAKGVVVSPPITNDALRAIARENAAPVAPAPMQAAPVVPAAVVVAEAAAALTVAPIAPAAAEPAAQ